MAPNTTRNAGRQLLVVNSRLKAENDPSKIASLKRQEALLFLELGQRDMAIAVATSRVEACPDGSRERAFLADILARSSQWAAAEQEFVQAHGICLRTGKLEKAASLAAGPLFLLAEARGDFRRCLDIAPIAVLRNRALRLLGEVAERGSIPAESPWKEIALLEEVHRGEDAYRLPDLLDSWTAGEAEWRWRVLYEGAFACVGAGMISKPWRKHLKQTGTKVLDPRYFTERRNLKRLLAGGFVNTGTS